jgi:hypothetical protein
MSYARQMLGTYSGDVKLAVDADVLARAIDAAGDCWQACATDIDADLNEPQLAEMVACIRLCQQCADSSAATAQVLSRPASWDIRLVRPLLEACVAICRSCGDECDRHAQMHAHCRVCAAACRSCERACSDLLTVMK